MNHGNYVGRRAGQDLLCSISDLPDLPEKEEKPVSKKLDRAT